MKKIALYDNFQKPEATAWAEFTAVRLNELGSEIFARPELLAAFSTSTAEFVKPAPLEEFDKYADVVISFGGDGTILSAVRTLMHSDIPIMGVNVGKLGFLAEFSTNGLEKSLSDLINGNYRVVDRFVLETTVNGDKLYALNDFVIEKKNSSRMITIQAYANENYIGDYRADGVILTTPTGSTAYSLSCGGPIISPATQVICLTPISPHSLNLRPLVIPDSCEITLKVYSPNGQAILVADGHTERVLENNFSVVFRKSSAKVKLIKPKQGSFYDLLRAKLLWSAYAVTESK